VNGCAPRSVRQRLSRLYKNFASGSRMCGAVTVLTRGAAVDTVTHFVCGYTSYRGFLLDSPKILGVKVESPGARCLCPEQARAIPGSGRVNRGTARRSIRAAFDRSSSRSYPERCDRWMGARDIDQFRPERFSTSFTLCVGSGLRGRQKPRRRTCFGAGAAGNRSREPHRKPGTSTGRAPASARDRTDGSFRSEPTIWASARAGAREALQWLLARRTLTGRTMGMPTGTAGAQARR
jgi:hypothetical protein